MSYLKKRKNVIIIFIVLIIVIVSILSLQLISKKVFSDELNNTWKIYINDTQTSFLSFNENKEIDEYNIVVESFMKKKFKYDIEFSGLYKYYDVIFKSNNIDCYYGYSFKEDNTLNVYYNNENLIFDLSEKTQEVDGFYMINEIDNYGEYITIRNQELKKIFVFNIDNNKMKVKFLNIFDNNRKGYNKDQYVLSIESKNGFLSSDYNFSVYALFELE